MANIRQSLNLGGAKPVIAEHKQEATTLNKLSSEISTFFQEAMKIISNNGERKVSIETKTQLQILFQCQSLQSCAMFLRGLEVIETQQKDTLLSSYRDIGTVSFVKSETRKFILRWSNLLQKLQDHFPKLAKRVHDLFLKNYTWQDLNSNVFFNLIERLMMLKEKPEKKRLRSWFNKYFQHIDPATKKSDLERSILKFNQFFDLCDKYNVYPSLVKPPKKVISFQLKGEDYIDNCNNALEQSETLEEKSRDHVSHRQAELLDQLPEARIIKQAFTQGLIVVCDKMVSFGMILAPLSKEALDANVNYNRYRSQALVFLSTNKNLSITKPLLFFNLLDKIPEKKLNVSEKLILSKGMVNCYLSDNQLNAQDFIKYSLELKNTFGSTYLEKIFDNSKNVMTCEDYLTTCQFLLELQDKIDIDNLITKNLPNIKNLNKELETFKLKLAQKKLPEEKLESVLDKFKTKSELVKFPLSEAEVKQLGNDYQVILDHGKILQKLPLSELSAAARKAGLALKENRNNRKASLELVSIIREVVNRVFHINPHNTQILALLSLITMPAGKKGRIGQIKTGEGKSLIDAMLAVYMGCQDKFVDIITSSPNLAIRDQKKYAQFFNIFGISSSHICHRRPEKAHFNGQILYGTNRDFEFSILRDKLYNREHRYTVLNGKLCKRTCDVAIVDEVDNLFLDTALSSARIATASPEAKPWIYAPILHYVKEQLELNENSLINLSQIRLILKEAYNGKYADKVDQIPDKKIIQWLTSAKIALEDKKPNRDYVIQPKKKPNGEEEKNKRQVVIVDYKNTGRLYPSTRWQHGLHEFIETKEGIEPQSESLTSASMSHPAFFNGYNEIYGLSGTVGEEVERKEIEAIYNLDTFDVPPHCRSQRYMLAPKLLESEEKQFETILTDIQSLIFEKRPILTLFNSIEQANKFSVFLATKNIKHQVLDDKQKEDEEYLISRAGRPGIVTIATNTAGRGTDIGLNLETIIAGGLHVILAFYPANIRVEQQGLGRSGRQGQPGTCRIILQINDEQILELVTIEQLEELLQDKDNFMNKLQDLRSKRVADESQYRLSKIQIDTIQHSVLKEFCKLLTFTRKKMAKLDGSELVNQLSYIKETIDEKKESSNPASQFIHKQALNLISQQTSGISVDWKSFLITAKNVFFEMILQKWATFFDHLNDEETKLTPELYKVQTFQRFHEFIHSNLAFYLENPVQGFYYWLNEFMRPSLEIPKKTKSLFYNKWINQIVEIFKPISLEYKKLDNEVNFYKPKPEKGFIRYELERVNQPITKVFQDRKLRDQDNDLIVLAKALAKGDLNRIKQLLLETRLDIKTAKINGDAPLIISAKNGHLDIVQWLLKTKNASIKDTSSNGSTALLWAADCGHLSVVQWLLKEGGASNREKTVVAENTVFLCAAYNSQLHVMQWLVENGYSSVHEKNKKDASALQYSAVNGNCLCIEWLLQQGVTIDEKNSVGNSAITLAAVHHQLKALKVLLSNGATLVADHDGDTPLHRAAIAGHLTMVESLTTEAKGSVNDRNNNGDTPLILAAANGHLPIVKWLLKNGSSVTERNNGELTPLIAAASNGQLTVMQWLLKHGGVSINEKDSNGGTALHHAVAQNHLHIVKYLLEGVSDIRQSLRYAKTDEMRLLLQEHSDKLKAITPKFSFTTFSKWKPRIPVSQVTQKNISEQKVVSTVHFAT